MGREPIRPPSSTPCMPSGSSWVVVERRIPAEVAAALSRFMEVGPKVFADGDESLLAVLGRNLALYVIP